MAKRIHNIWWALMHLQGATSKSAAKEAIPYRGNQYINKKNKRLPRSIKERVPNLAHLHNYNKISINKLKIFKILILHLLSLCLNGSNRKFYLERYWELLYISLNILYITLFRPEVFTNYLRTNFQRISKWGPFEHCLTFNEF